MHTHKKWLISILAGMALLAMSPLASADVTNVETHPALDGHIIQYYCSSTPSCIVKPNDAMKWLGMPGTLLCNTPWASSRIYDSFNTLVVPAGATVTSLHYGFNVVTIMQFGEGPTNTSWRVFWDYWKLHINGLNCEDWGSLHAGYVDFDPGWGAGWKSIPIPVSAFRRTIYFDFEVMDRSALPSPEDGYRWNIRAVQEGQLVPFEAPRLIVEYELNGVSKTIEILANSPGTEPVGESTWGAIKSIYK